MRVYENRLRDRAVLLLRDDRRELFDPAIKYLAALITPSDGSARERGSLFTSSRSPHLLKKKNTTLLLYNTLSELWRNRISTLQPKLVDIQSA